MGRGKRPETIAGVGEDLLERLPVGCQGLLSAGDVHKGHGGALHVDSARLVMSVNAAQGCENAKHPSPAPYLAAPVALLLEASSPPAAAAAAGYPFAGCCWDLW